MCKHVHIKLFKATTLTIVALTLFAHGALAQSTITMPTSGSRTDTLHAGVSYTLVDPGGMGNYPNSCTSMLRLVSDSGTAIRVGGLVRTEYNNDFLYVYEGLSCNESMLGYYTGLVSADITALTGAMTMLFTSNAMTNFNGFALSVEVCPVASNAARGIVIDTVTASSARLTWEDGIGSGSWTIQYGLAPGELDTTLATDTTAITISGLAANTTYYFSVSNGSVVDSGCERVIHKLRTTCDEALGGCIDYGNLASCYAKASYGTFINPWLHQGIVDYGSGNSLSRHTVHNDTTETDPRTNNLLRTVAPGHETSVRLGNWEVGGEAESITYEYRVDTTASDLLLLKYAAVLQVPNHTAAEQPRFAFMILDEDGNEINSSCYSANFIANSSLGWNRYSFGASEANDVLWKDWTTVGIDLAPLEGETIFIRLMTSDCSHQQHFGYAYFVLDCTRKMLTAESCGAMVENTFTAPDGFGYQWYKSSEPEAIIATTRSLHVTSAGEYRCLLSFVGAPEGADCSFELAAIADARFPAAIMGWDSLGRLGCDLAVALHNNSVISRDSNHCILTSELCDGAEWVVDGAAYSNEDEATVILTPGLHSVQLIASLNNGSCSDTTLQTIFVGNPCYRNDTLELVVCQGDTVWMFDSAYTSSGIFQGDSGYHHRTLILTVSPRYADTVAVTIVENELPFGFAGMQFLNSVSDTVIELLSAMGCDSVVHLSLTVFPNKFSILDSSICENELPLRWNDVLFTNDSSASHTFAGESATGTDSTVLMTVHVRRNSGLTRRDTVVENQLPVLFAGRSFYDSVEDSIFIIQNHLGCDSVLTYNLHVWFNVMATADSGVCDSQLPLVWNGVTFNGPDSITINLAAIGIQALHGEDSILTMRVAVFGSTSSTIHDTVVENQLPYSWEGHTFYESLLAVGTATSSDLFHQANTLNANGCDSSINYHLHVWHNSSAELDSTVCADALPMVWEGHRFEGDSLAYHYLFTIPTAHGADSNITLTLYVMPTYDISDTVVICEGDTADHGFTQSGDHVLRLVSIGHCDSTVHLHVVVHPAYHFVYEDTICDNQNTIFNGVEVCNAGLHEAALSSIHGCDSLLSLRLCVFPTYHHYDRALVCDGVPYRWIDGNTYSFSTYEPSIFYTDIHGCDSVLHLLLDLDDNFKASMELAPDVVDIDHREVRLRDLSRSHSREWFILGFNDFDDGCALASKNVRMLHDTARFCSFWFPMEEDSMQVLLVARTMAGCIDSVWGSVRCDKALFWAPNAFTPGEMHNSKFLIISNQLASGEVWIYDRKGLVVSHFNIIDGSWDGTHKGQACPQATYTWLMRFSTLAQPRQTKTAKGTVTLIR